MARPAYYLVGIAAILCTLSSVQATLIAEWTFEGSFPDHNGPHAAESGVNSGAGSPATGFHAQPGTNFAFAIGNGSSMSFNADRWAIGDYFQFCTSTTGFQGISITWDHMSTTGGPRDWQLKYNVNGGPFVNLGAPYQVRPNPFPLWGPSGPPNLADRRTASFVLAPEVYDSPGFCVRVSANTSVAIGGGTVVTSGQSRVDNFQIEGTVVPEPSTLILLSVCALAMIRRRRRAPSFTS
jgi:PEP-CTERM motif-containing protein